MIVIPTELFSKRARKAVRSIDCLGVGVVVSENGKHWAFDVRFEHAVDTSLSVLDVRTRQLVLRIVRHKITSVDCPRQGCIVRPSSS